MFFAVGNSPPLDVLASDSDCIDNVDPEEVDEPPKKDVISLSDAV